MNECRECNQSGALLYCQTSWPNLKCGIEAAVVAESMHPGEYYSIKNARMMTNANGYPGRKGPREQDG